MSSAAAPTSGLLARLRRETSAEHAALEAAVPLASDSVSRADYVRFLTLVGVFHAAVEQQLGSVEGLAAVIADLPERRKTARLESDFAALGLDPATLAPASAARRLCPIVPDRHAPVPSLTTLSQAVGILYVLEGSTLGSQLLHRQLSVALPELMPRASDFLRCYGSATGPMWSSFRRQVEQSAPLLDGDAVVDAAREAFAVLLDWFGESAGPRSTDAGDSRDSPPDESVAQRVA